MTAAFLTPLVNHLWQSTLFAAVAVLLALALRKHHAPARHWLWLAASVKFLIPFSFLISMGSHLAPRTISRFRMAVVLEGSGGPMVPFSMPSPASPSHSILASTPDSWAAVLLAIWLCGAAIVLVGWWTRWRRIRSAVLAAQPLHEGREFEALRRLERSGGFSKPIALLSSSSSLEPGIFGILRPALVLPSSIATRLSDAQLDAVLAHELCHVRRRDNLAGAIHMLVETIFWFHPLVWWLGARLVEERERACDGEVLYLGNEPQVYAESILKVCEFYLESPLMCAPGVTGANLKRRIEDIMTYRITQRLDFARKILLAGFGMAALAAPVFFGLVNAPQIRAQEKAAAAAPKEFEVAAIKPSAPGGRGVRIQMAPGGRFTTSNVPVKFLIQTAYGVKDFQISGGPAWINSERFDVEAKADSDISGPDQLRPLVQKLLADRFQLTIHRETKELPIYALVVAKGGSKLKENNSAPGPQIMLRRGTISGQAMPMEMLASQLSGPLGRTVIDRTGLKGQYDVKLEWTPDDNQPVGHGEGAAPPPDTTGPSLFTALQEQLGLKLESSKGPVEIIVIDRVEKPSEN